MESPVFRGMCDALPAGELQKTVDAKDALRLVKGFAKELKRQREKPAETAQRTLEIQDLRL